MSMRSFIRGVQREEQAWLMKGFQYDKTYLSYMPYQAADFCAIMFDVVAESEGDHFLDVGCGPGVKMHIAKKMFGLNVRGIEIDAPMAEEAKKIAGNASVACQDALDHADWYGQADIIWLYRPFRDPVKEDELERLIIHRMKPGAILAGGAWEMAVPPTGWLTIVDDWELKRGAWKKIT